MSLLCLFVSQADLKIMPLRSLSLLAAMSTSTRSFPLSRPRELLFLSIWAIIILAIVKFLLNTCMEYNI